MSCDLITNMQYWYERVKLWFMHEIIFGLKIIHWFCYILEMYIKSHKVNFKMCRSKMCHYFDFSPSIEINIY